MAFHHLAVATHDMAATHAFYTQAMGFELVKVEKAQTPSQGWAKHFFYQTGDGELMAFWELHDPTLPKDFPTGLSRAAGLPDWVNHVAFAARDLDDIEARKDRWLAHGYPVVEIDHDWCYSIYTNDPGGTLVEFCTTVRPFTEKDAEIAHRALGSDDLAFSPQPEVKVHKATSAPAHERISDSAAAQASR
jgi:catechol 2,3-dioxygenase-like lactoylglutathione lyase family enzyme